VGNKRFHSFQAWREKDGGRPTYVYGLTLTQIEAIRSRADEELSSENTELKAQLEAAKRAFSELEQRTATKGTTLAQENAKLKEERQWYIQTLRPLLNRQTNNFTARGNSSIHAIPIPMGGSPKHRIKPKRR